LVRAVEPPTGTLDAIELALVGLVAVMTAIGGSTFVAAIGRLVPLVTAIRGIRTLEPGIDSIERTELAGSSTGAAQPFGSGVPSRYTSGCHRHRLRDAFSSLPDGPVLEVRAARKRGRQTEPLLVRTRARFGRFLRETTVPMVRYPRATVRLFREGHERTGRGTLAGRRQAAPHRGIIRLDPAFITPC
jgi:hypothetical protein